MAAPNSPLLWKFKGRQKEAVRKNREETLSFEFKRSQEVRRKEEKCSKLSNDIRQLHKWESRETLLPLHL